MNNLMYFRKGDNSEAFDNHAIKISFKKTEDLSKVSKLVFVCGCIKKAYNPQPFFYVDFNEQESAKLRDVNVGYLVAYDNYNRELTCKGSIKFGVKNGVICKC